jgi:hypothetical protein
MNPAAQADRVAAMRATEKRNNGLSQQAAAAERQRSEIRELGAAASNLIPQVLGLLAARGYPGIEEVNVYVPRTGISRVLGAERLAQMGAYRVSEYYDDESAMRPAGVSSVRLLSNGRMNIGPDSHSVAEFVQQVLNHEGLGDKGLWNLGEPYSHAGLENFVAELRKLV